MTGLAHLIHTYSENLRPWNTLFSGGSRFVFNVSLSSSDLQRKLESQNTLAGSLWRAAICYKGLSREIAVAISFCSKDFMYFFPNFDVHLFETFVLATV